MFACIRFKDIEAIDDGEKISTCSVTDPSNEWSAFGATRWLYSKALAQAKLKLMYSLVPVDSETSANEKSEISVSNSDVPLDVKSFGKI